MNIQIFWHGENHGDPDNVFKGIADALFADDKHLDGSFNSQHQKGDPRVEVCIVFHEENTSSTKKEDSE